MYGGADEVSGTSGVDQVIRTGGLASSKMDEEIVSCEKTVQNDQVTLGLKNFYSPCSHNMCECFLNI